MRTSDTVVAGCDPHKRTMTVAIVDGNGATIDARSFPNTPAGFAAVTGWLAGLDAVVARSTADTTPDHGAPRRPTRPRRRRMALRLSASPQPARARSVHDDRTDGAAIGNVIAVISPHPIVTTVITNIALFFVMLFSPINFPIERLPGWLQTAHEILPVAPMAELARTTLVGTATSTTDWLHVGKWAIGSFIMSAAASARRR